MFTVNPYLTFNGNCEEAFNFYCSVFGGELKDFNRYENMPSEQPIPEEQKQKIMHVSLPINDTMTLMGCDSSDAFGKATNIGNNVALFVNTDSEERAREVFTKLSEGGTITMPFQATFWSALFGMFTDKYGIHWMVNYEKTGS